MKLPSACDVDQPPDADADALRAGWTVTGATKVSAESCDKIVGFP